MAKPLRVLLYLAWPVTLLLAGTVALADISFPTKTTIYFRDSNNQPIRAPMTFKLACYGYAARPNTPGFGKPYPPVGTYTPVVVWSVSADCPQYGCLHTKPYYFNYVRVDYCDLEGHVGDKSFRLEKFRSEPINERAKCKVGADHLSVTCSDEIKLPM